VSFPPQQENICLKLQWWELPISNPQSPVFPGLLNLIIHRHTLTFNGQVFLYYIQSFGKGFLIIQKHMFKDSHSMMLEDKLRDENHTHPMLSSVQDEALNTALGFVCGEKTFHFNMENPSG
jgi:hypothetical protein